jgi:nicotinate-nucleotide pyrophosphorylase (carboxylating)
MDLDSGIIYAFAADLLKEDLVRGDITTQIVVRGGAKARGRFVANQDCVLCGLEIAEAVFATLDNSIMLESRAYDGERLPEGDEFARIEGPATALLTGEGAALSIMRRLSGVATLTKAFVDRIEGTGARIVDTRKTTPGLRLLEKYAVTVGGGVNSRFGLDDGVLIEQAHIPLAGGVRRAVELARRGAPHLMKIEVEVANQQQLRESIESRADVVRLANMPLDEIRESAKLIRDGSPNAIIEVSGGISLDNVVDFAACGVDLISVDVITHAATTVDISLKTRPL